jgi:hypothetical protein
MDCMESRDDRTHHRHATGVGSGIGRELCAHMPFTFFGALTGLVIMVVVIVTEVPLWISAGLFWMLHPLHVLLSALVTAAIWTRHNRSSLATTLVIGYVGSVGIATLSDCVIPYLGEILLDLPDRDIHLGFIEKWWLVNPLALAGILIGYYWPHTKFPHAGHVFLSTWASLFHLLMAGGGPFSLTGYTASALFLFLAVWIPCCTSDIVFPLLFSPRTRIKEARIRIGCRHGK